MDDIVKQAMAKWPNVPDCYGWLGLDARGNWYMRDDSTQSLGGFASGHPQAKGSLLKHQKLIDFIARNYAADPAGRWYFQNGPQRVYVELEVAPWVWRVADDLSVSSHTELPQIPIDCLTDESGRVYLVCPMGIGLVHTQDVSNVALAIERGLWSPKEVVFADLQVRYGFMQSPQQEQLKQSAGA